MDILGIDIDANRKLIKFQLTHDLDWSNIENDLAKPISTFDVCNDEELKESFNWINTQQFIEETHQHKRTKFFPLEFRLRFIKSHQFLRLNEEGLNTFFHTLIHLEKSTQRKKEYIITLTKFRVSI